MPFAAPTGINFRTVTGLTMGSLRQSLDVVAEFIKSRDTYGYLLRFDDWWQHNGEPMPKGKLSWEAFADRYADEDAVAASMPKRHEVRVGICGPGMEWYLRYFIDASGGHASLDLTVPPEWEQDFHGVMEALAPVSWARSSAAEYYEMIRRGATPVSAGRDISRISREAAVASSARFEGLADNLSFGGGFGSLFKGKFVGAVGVGILIILGYLLLSNLHFS